jgi:hypothetical protein
MICSFLCKSVAHRSRDDMNLREENEPAETKVGFEKAVG